MNETPKKTANQKKPIFERPLALVMWGFFVLLALWVIMTVVIPLVRGDGLSGYSGAKKQAAQNALDISMHNIDNKSRWAYSFHIDDVRPVSNEEKMKFCQNSLYITNDPNNVGYYSAVVNMHTLFSLSSTTRIYIGCNPHPYNTL